LKAWKLSGAALPTGEVICIKDGACSPPDHVFIPLSLPSPARGEGFKSPFLDGKGRGVPCAEIAGYANALGQADTISDTKLAA